MSSEVNPQIRSTSTALVSAWALLIMIPLDGPVVPDE